MGGGGGFGGWEAGGHDDRARFLHVFHPTCRPLIGPMRVSAARSHTGQRVVLQEQVHLDFHGRREQQSGSVLQTAGPNVLLTSANKHGNSASRLAPEQPTDRPSARPGADRPLAFLRRVVGEDRAPSALSPSSSSLVGSRSLLFPLLLLLLPSPLTLKTPDHCGSRTSTAVGRGGSLFSFPPRGSPGIRAP